MRRTASRCSIEQGRQRVAPFLSWPRHGLRHARDEGVWPDIPPEQRRQYSIAEIKRHLGTFVYRFFQLSQYKRSAIPNAPKVGSGGSLSPRGDWRAPSDGNADAWLRNLAEVPAK